MIFSASKSVEFAEKPCLPKVFVRIFTGPDLSAH